MIFKLIDDRISKRLYAYGYIVNLLLPLIVLYYPYDNGRWLLLFAVISGCVAILPQAFFVVLAAMCMLLNGLNFGVVALVILGIIALVSVWLKNVPPYVKVFVLRPLLALLSFQLMSKLGEIGA